MPCMPEEFTAPKERLYGLWLEACQGLTLGPRMDVGVMGEKVHSSPSQNCRNPEVQPHH